MADGKQTLVPRGPIGVWHALMWSLKGLVTAFRVESSFRLEVYLAVLLAPLGLWLGADPLERALLVGCLFLVLSAAHNSSRVARSSRIM